MWSFVLTLSLLAGESHGYFPNIPPGVAAVPWQNQSSRRVANANFAYCGSQTGYSGRPTSTVTIAASGTSCSGTCTHADSSGDAMFGPYQTDALSNRDFSQNPFSSPPTYMNYMRCYWNIQATSTLRAVVYFNSNYLSGSYCSSSSTSTTCAMNIESQSTCNYDYVTARYGLSTSAAQTAVGRTFFPTSKYKSGLYLMCSRSQPAPLPVYTIATGNYGMNWEFKSDHSVIYRGFEGRVKFFTPISLQNFPTSVTSCISPTSTPGITLLTYNGATKTDESYTVTVSVASGGSTLQGVTSATSSSGVAKFPSLAICGVSSGVTLRFVSEAFDYTHETAIVVNAGVPSTPAQPLLDGLSTASTIPLKWTLPSDNGQALTGCTVQYFAMPGPPNEGSDPTVDAGAGVTTITLPHPAPAPAGTPSLSAGQDYQVRVKCSNSAGDSPYSPYTSVSTQAAATVLRFMTPTIFQKTPTASVTVTIFGNINPTSTHNCVWSSPTASPSYTTQTTTATVVGNTQLTCSPPGTTPSFECTQRALPGNLQITGGTVKDFNIMFYYNDPSCYEIARISVDFDCSSDYDTCVDTVPAIGGKLLYLYDNTITSQHWTWLVDNSVDKTTMKCKFEHATGSDVVVSATYQLNEDTQEGIVYCLIPSHAATTANVSLSFDNGVNYMVPASGQGILTYEACGVGYKAATPDESCTVCGTGTFSNQSTATTCTECSTGKVAVVQGLTVCTDCDFGSYASVTGSAQCSNCELGKFVALKGQSTCNTCDPGSYASETGSVTCEQCPVGKFSEINGASVCTDCAPGKYSASAQSTICLSCPVGTASNSSGRSSCTSCAPGHYGPSVGLADCLACGLGDYNGLSGQQACTQCPTAASTNLLGSITPLSCNCVSSFHCTGSCGTTSMVCAPCPSGAVCLQGEEVRASAGHYRTTDGSVVECYNKDACLGASTSRRTGSTNVCAEGCTGPVCLSCLDGYAMNMRYLCQPCPSDDTLLAAMIFIAVGFTMVLIIIAWLSNRLGQNFAEQSVAERERKMIALKKRQALMQSVAAPKLLQVLQEKVECRVRDAVIVTSADVQVDLASSTTEACKVLASIRAWSADASRHQALGNISDALEAQAQVDDLQETARKMVMFAPGDIRQCAMEQVYSESLESRNVTCLETKADLDVGPTTSLSLDDMGEVLNHQTKRTREREFWQQLSWGEKLQAILEEDGAEEAIEAAFQYQLKLETTAAENSGAHVLSHMQQEDKIQNRLKSVGHKRTRWSSMLQDRIGTEGGYGSCSPVLLFKVFFSALQVLALARRYDFEWPGYLQEVFEAQATASGGNTFTVDCFFPGTIGKVYERAALMVITPPILGMIAFSYFMLRYLFGLKGIPSLITGPLFGTNEDLEGTGFVVMTRAQKEFLRSIMLPETDDIFLCILNKWPTRLELWRPVKDLVTGEFLRFQHKYNHNTAPWKSQEELISAVQQQESSGEREVIPGWALKDFLCKIVPHTDRFGITRKMWTLDFTQGRRKEEDLYNLDDNSADDTARLRLAQIAIADGFAQHAKLRLKDQAADKFKQTCHVWGFLLWPVLTQEVLSLFSCYSIGDTYYIFGETEIECYTGDYWLYAVVIGLPGLCMSFGLLFATYSVVKTNASKIRNCDFRTTRKYAFLFADYSTEHHYWEVCIMLRKLGAVISAVCLVSAGVVAQALACLFVITAAAVAHIRARPYDHWLPDALESASLFTCFVTLYFGVYLHTVSESSFAEACSVIILMVQMLFVSFFIFALIRSLQAFAEQAQITAFISESARLSTCQFGWLYFKTRATCKNLDDQLFSLALPADKLVQNLTKHLYGWPIEKRWDMYNLIRDKYSPRWKAFVSNRRSEKYGLVLCQLFSSLENVRSHHSLKSTFASLMFNWEQYREWLKKGKLERRVTRMARLYEDPDHTHQVTAPRIAPARGANGDDSGEPM